MTEGEGGNDGGCASLAGTSSMHCREQQDMTETEMNEQEHRRPWMPLKESVSHRQWGKEA